MSPEITLTLGLTHEQYETVIGLFMGSYLASQKEIKELKKEKEDLVKKLSDLQITNTNLATVPKAWTEEAAKQLLRGQGYDVYMRKNKKLKSQNKNKESKGDNIIKK